MPSLSLFRLLGATACLAFFSLLLPQTTEAATGDIQSIRLLDLDTNGHPDTVAVAIDNPSGFSWQLKGAAPHGFGVFYKNSANPITIQNVKFQSTTTASTVVLHLTLDANSPHAQHGSGNDLEVTYTAVTNPNSPTTCSACVSGVGAVSKPLEVIEFDDIAENAEIDAMGPQILTSAYLDQNKDAHVDAIRIGWSEALHVGTSTLSAQQLSISKTGDFAGASFGTSPSDLITENALNGQDLIIPFSSRSSQQDTHDDSGQFTVAINEGFVFDTAGNKTTLTRSISPTDEAHARLIQQHIALDGAGSSQTLELTYVFSETMRPIAELTSDAWRNVFWSALTPAPENGWSLRQGPDTQTIVIRALGPTCGERTIISTPGTLVAQASSVLSTREETVTTGLTNLSTTITAPECNTTSEQEPTPTLSPTPESDDSLTAPANPGSTQDYRIALTLPNNGETYTAGDNMIIRWQDTGTKKASTVDLWYRSSRNQDASLLIAKNTTNDGRFDWTIPDEAVGRVYITVQGVNRDRTSIVSSDVSDQAVTVRPGPHTPPQEETVVTPTPNTNFTSFPPGIFIKSVSFPTVYYIEQDGKRRPFYNSHIFFTWTTSFDHVVIVPDSALPNIPLGAPMLPRRGTTLVKIQSVPKVYALEEVDGVLKLRWIATEEAAISIFGPRWADYVIDLPPTIFGRFGEGKDIRSTADFQVDWTVMNTRAHLARCGC